MAVRERKGADWFGRLSGEWGRFPMNPRVVEGCRCPGESFESNGELGGGRKWPIGAGRGGGVRGEEREGGKGLVGSLPQMQTSFLIPP